MPHLSTFLNEKGYFACSAFFKIHSNFSDKLLSQATINRCFKKLEDGTVKLQPSLWREACDLKSWMIKRRLWGKTLNTSLEIPLCSLTVLRMFAGLGYKKKWSNGDTPQLAHQPWQRKASNSCTPVSATVITSFQIIVAKEVLFFALTDGKIRLN